MLQDQSSFSWDFMSVYEVEKQESLEEKPPLKNHEDEEAALARKIAIQPNEFNDLELGLSYGDFPVAPPDDEGEGDRSMKTGNEAKSDDDLEPGFGYPDFPMALSDEEARLAFTGFPLSPVPADQEAARDTKIGNQSDKFDGLELALGFPDFPMAPPDQPDNQHDPDSDSDPDQDQDPDPDLDTSSLIQGIGRDNTIYSLVKCSRSNYASIALLNRSFRELIRSGELYRMRRYNGVIEHWVYFSCHILKWVAFDPANRKWMNLPVMNVNPCFQFSDKESLAVGTELLVLGREVFSHAIYKYSLLTNSWSVGQPMSSPRCLFGSASSGHIAIFAGGSDAEGKIMDAVEQYDSDSGAWETLTSLPKPRKMCSGVFMDGKFYVIGGVGVSKGKPLTCGEEYDFETKKWTEIPGMSPMKVIPAGEPVAPPLVAVVDNELYAADALEKVVKKYNKQKNEWETLGGLPERAHSMNGWGVAFRGCGDRVLVVGGPRTSGDRYIEVYSWVPKEGPLRWTLIGWKKSSNFVYNCAVMGC